MKSRKKLSPLEWALLVIPLLSVAVLTLHGPLRSWWEHSSFNRWTSAFQSNKDMDIREIAFANDSRSLAVVFWDHKAREGHLDIVNVADQKLKQTLPLKGYGRMIWSPQNDRIVMSALTGTAVWDLTSGQRIFRRQSPPNIYEHVHNWKSNDVLEITYRASNQRMQKPNYRKAHINIGTGDLIPQGVISGSARLGIENTHWVSPNKLWELFVTETKYVSDKSTSPRARFYSRTEGGRLELRERKSGRKLRTFNGDLFSSAIFTSDTSISAYARVNFDYYSDSERPQAMLFRFDTARESGSWEFLKSEESPSKFSPDGRFLVTTNMRSHTLNLRNSKTWHLVKSFDDCGNSYQIHFSPDSRFLAYISMSQNVVNIVSVPNS
jgi:hypothetical protein